MYSLTVSQGFCKNTKYRGLFDITWIFFLMNGKIVWKYRDLFVKKKLWRWMARLCRRVSVAAEMFGAAWVSLEKVTFLNICPRGERKVESYNTPFEIGCRRHVHKHIRKVGEVHYQLLPFSIIILQSQLYIKYPPVPFIIHVTN